MSLYWTIYNTQRPVDDSKCIVAHINNNKKSIAGIFRFHSAGDNSYWQKGDKIINCKPNDCWCQVDSIINSIVQRIEDEVKEEFSKRKFL